MSAADWDVWDQAQVAEKGHWAALWQPADSLERQYLAESEAKKGDFIFHEMSMHFEIDPTKDWSDKAVLDVGCGPVSLVARSKLGKTRTGVDPLRYPHWVYEAYRANSFNVIMEPFEEMSGPDKYDVIVMYNSLQHFADLRAVANRSKDIVTQAGEIYLSEYLQVPTNEAHIQFLEDGVLNELFTSAGVKVDSAVVPVRLPGLVERPGGEPIDLYVARMTLA